MPALSRTGDKIDINVVIDTKGLGDSVGVELVFLQGGAWRKQNTTAARTSRW